MSAVIDLTRHPDLRPHFTRTPLGWCCVDDNTYDGHGCPIGYGPTKLDALAALLDQLPEPTRTIDRGREEPPEVVADHRYGDDTW